MEETKKSEARAEKPRETHRIVPIYHNMIGKVLAYKGRFGKTERDGSWIPVGGTCIVVEGTTKDRLFKVLVAGKIILVNRCYIKGEAIELAEDGIADLEVDPVRELQEIAQDIANVGCHRGVFPLGEIENEEAVISRQDLTKLMNRVSKLASYIGRDK